MKKLLFILTLIAIGSVIVPSITNELSAQLTTKHIPPAVKDTLENTDTTTITFTVDNIARSVELYGNIITGTPTSTKMYLQGQVGSGRWYNVDSLTPSAAIPGKVIPLRDAGGSLLYKSYRVYVLSAGTVKWSPQVYLLRRSN